MSELDLRHAERGDMAALIEANRASETLHHPWVSPPVDQASFDTWFAQTVTGANVSLIARLCETGQIVGVFNLSNIVLGNFRSCFLGYYGMANAVGRGWITKALSLSLIHI